MVELVDNRIQPYLDASGDPVIIAEPFEAGGHPFYDSQGNPILVLGRNIDAGGSGIIAQNIIAKASGISSGLFVGLTIDITTAGLGPIVTYSQDPPKIGDGPGGGPPIQTDPGIGPVLISETSSSAPPPPAVQKTDAPTADTAATVATKTDNQDDGFGDDEDKKKGKGIALARKISRVTLLLPRKN